MSTRCTLICFVIVFLIEKTICATQNDVDDYVPFYDTGLKDEFDWQLLKAVSSNPNYKNIIISPISLKIVLALLYEGAGGTTEKEIQNVMRFNENKTLVRQEFADIIESLQNYRHRGCNDSTTNNISDVNTFNIGTKIYLDSDLQPQQSFQSKACEKYQTRIEPTNFTDSERASANINNWVNKLTYGKISRLVEADDVKDAVLLIANAIYFKGFWRHQFPRNQTHHGGFYLTPTKISRVEYMATTDNYFFTEAKNLDAKIIRIPYKDNKFSMILVLPNAKAGLAQLIKYHNLATITAHVNIMDKVSVDLILPKFKFDFQTRMTGVLKSLGLTSIFENTASLAGITRGKGVKLSVSDIIQKSGIEVNEEGSIAYAATDITIVNKFGDAQAIFNATHPFLFFIEDQTKHTILFVGKVENPLEVDAVALPSRFGGTGLDNTQPSGVTVAPQ